MQKLWSYSSANMAIPQHSCTFPDSKYPSHCLASPEPVISNRFCATKVPNNPRLHCLYSPRPPQKQVPSPIVYLQLKPSKHISLGISMLSADFLECFIGTSSCSVLKGPLALTSHRFEFLRHVNLLSLNCRAHL